MEILNFNVFSKNFVSKKITDFRVFEKILVVI